MFKCLPATIAVIPDMQSVVLFFLAELQALCKKLHSQISSSEEDKYDLEVKLAGQEAEVEKWPANILCPFFIPFLLLLPLCCR